MPYTITVTDVVLTFSTSAYYRYTILFDVLWSICCCKLYLFLSSLNILPHCEKQIYVDITLPNVSSNLKHQLHHQSTMAQVGEGSAPKSKQDKKARRAAKVQQKGENPQDQTGSDQSQSQDRISKGSTDNQRSLDNQKEKKPLTKAERRALQVGLLFMSFSCTICL